MFHSVCPSLNEDDFLTTLNLDKIHLFKKFSLKLEKKRFFVLTLLEDNSENLPKMTSKDCTSGKFCFGTQDLEDLSYNDNFLRKYKVFNMKVNFSCIWTCKLY